MYSSPKLPNDPNDPKDPVDPTASSSINCKTAVFVQKNV